MQYGPRKHRTISLRNSIMVRVSDQEAHWIDQSAQASGLPISTFIRQLIVKEANRNLPRQGEPDEAA